MLQQRQAQGRRSLRERNETCSQRFVRGANNDQLPLVFLMQLAEWLLMNLAIVAAVLFLLWLVSLPLRNASIVDIFWGLGFVLVAWASLVIGGAASFGPLLIVTLVTVWGLRLAGYLAWRNIGKPEDYRYRQMREHHGTRFPLVSLFTVFALQGLLLWIISLPVQVAILGEPGGQAYEWAGWRWLGVALWMLGLFFEGVGDWQLARFKARPENRGRVMNRGLWRYTRHPNYFGDFLVWWGLYVVTAQSGSWWWTIIGPLLMSFLLLRVSGVRLLESSLKHRVDGYREYVQTTNAFFPGPKTRAD